MSDMVLKPWHGIDMKEDYTVRLIWCQGMAGH
jgi:hypothetical protein